jgi:hypothetical protein
VLGFCLPYADKTSSHYRYKTILGSRSYKQIASPGEGKGLTMNTKTSIALLLMTIAIAGCNRSTNALNVNTQAPPEPLPSVPSGNVQSAQLEPVAAPTPSPVVQAPAAPTAPTAPEVPKVEEIQPEIKEVESASLQAKAPSNEPLTHESLAGSWNVASDSAACRTILAFTKQFDGDGFRATTLRCNAAELQEVSSWDVKGPKVVLLNKSGNQVASLASVGAERYAGVTSSGRAITFSR